MKSSEVWKANAVNEITMTVVSPIASITSFTLYVLEMTPTRKDSHIVKALSNIIFVGDVRRAVSQQEIAQIITIVNTIATIMSQEFAATNFCDGPWRHNNATNPKVTSNWIYLVS